MKKYSLMRVPSLTQSHKQKRLDYIYGYNKDLMDKTLYTDEKWFYLQRLQCGRWSAGVYAFDKKTRHRYVKETKNKSKVQLWAGISRKGCTPPVIMHGNVDANMYCKVLEAGISADMSKKMVDGDVIFQQDNAPCHTAQYTDNYLQTKKWCTFKWPPHSPDFSPIEFLWAALTAQLDLVWHPSNLRDAITAITHIWPIVTSPAAIQSYFDRAMHNMMQSMVVDGSNEYCRKRRAKVAMHNF